jgi:P-type Ca2+ transporter type 2C
LPEAVPRSGLSIFLGQFESLPVALLGVAAGVSLLTGGVADALVIAGVVLINATVGYGTESQSEEIMFSLRHLVQPNALTLRNGTIQDLGAAGLVLGDLLVLKPGSYVAADARLIEVDRLTVDESVLTGESLPVSKNSARLLDGDIPLAERLNMVYMGTLITGGQGLAIVVATGKFTEMGKVQALATETISPDTPLEKQLDDMGRQLVWVSTGVCGLVFVIGLLRGLGLLPMLQTAISLAVAAVPEGLPTVATTTLALGIRTMQREHVLIRRLSAVETLGCVQTICLDKTGTITENRMRVLKLFSGVKRVTLADGLFLADEERLTPLMCEELRLLMHTTVLCSEVEAVSEGDVFALRGSATETALLHMAIQAGVNPVHLKQQYPCLKMTLRSEACPIMTTLHGHEHGGALLFVKGSPAEVLTRCAWHLQDGVARELRDEERELIQMENERMAGEALRVLGMAYVRLDGAPPTIDPLEQRLIWLGLVGMADPIRPIMPKVIKSFHEAGIETVMITGDQSATAYAVGKELNLSRGNGLKILDSTRLSGLDQGALDALATKVDVFARVNPSHKLQIVQALQRSGKVVAMTGDGINDGPALKAADIGIAMGQSGTEVAREVADVILEDDNLETMIVAVRQGRTIYGNIRKSVRFLLATNLSEIIVMTTALALGMGQPLTAMHLLWINLVSDIAPGLALSLEAPEPDVLNRPPRDPAQPIVSSSDIGHIATDSAVISAGALGVYGYGLAKYGAGPSAGGLCFSALVVGQLLHALSCRSENHSFLHRTPLPPNPYLTYALGGSLGLQLLTLVVPGLRGFLGLRPMTLLDSVVVACGGVGTLLINELRKPPEQEHATLSLVR